MKKSLPLILVLIALSSCRKDVTERTEENCNNPNFSSSQSITVGDTSNMYYHELNDTTRIMDIHGATSHYKKIWCNDSLDLIVSASYIDGPLDFNSYTFDFTSETSLEFYQKHEDFIAYLIQDTSYSGSNPVIMTIADGYSSDSIYSNNPVYSVHDQLIYLDSGEQINKTEYYSSVAQIKRESWGYPPNMEEVVNDTQKVFITEYDLDGYDLINNSRQFIGFKMIVEGTIKLGWIQVERIGGYLIIIDYAVQK